MEESISRTDQITNRTIREMRTYTNFSVLSEEQESQLHTVIRELVEAAIALESNQNLDDEQLFQFVAIHVFSMVGVVKNERGLNRNSNGQN